MDNDSNTLDSSGNNGKPSESEPSSNDQRSNCCCPARYRVYSLVALLVLSFAGWWLYSTRDYWQDAWTQGTVTPQRRAGQRSSSFDVSTAIVPAGEILSGGPPKDGIPALTDPKFITAGEATYLQAADRVIGFVSAGEARAYPLKILDYHEIINDRIGDLAVADRRTPVGEREFGVSGLLYNSNVLMYDRGGEPESLWSQVMTKGVSGPAARKSLTALPLELTTWKDWQTRHPGTKVLSTQTGHARDYNRSPYRGYFAMPDLMFPATPESDRLPTKSRILGVWTDEAARAYPESMFSPDRTRVEDEFDGKKIVIEFNPEAKSVRVVEADDGIHWMYSLWFAWYAMRPETDVFSP